MLYNAIDVARHIVSRCYSIGKPISNLQLQKLLYFVWIDYFKNTGKSLFLDSICAWQFGPVIPDIYHEYCSYGGRPILEVYGDSMKEMDADIVNKTIDNKIDIPVNMLVQYTHRKGSAWDIVYEGGVGNREVIPFSLIKEKECGY